jgi:catechol 2,3-dioxygenase-like lactoylglutathione lyase family enzyme
MEAAMGIGKLDHFSIRTLKLDETRSFYVNVLSLTDGPRPPLKFPGVWLYNGNDAVVHLIGIDPQNPSATTDYLGVKEDRDAVGTGTLDHVAFVATGLSEMQARLSKAEMEFRERTIPGLGLHQIFLEDPNGLTIELNYPAEELVALRS